MTTIPDDSIERLIQIEAGVHYSELPPPECKPFVIVERKSPVILSAPHGTRTKRNNKDQIWHEEDEYTAGMAQLLGDLSDASVIAMIYSDDQYDPNYCSDDKIPYKQALKRMIVKNKVRYVIDLHGAALYSTSLDSNQTIDLGFRDNSNSKESSMTEQHIRKLESLLQDTGQRCDPKCFVVGRNKLAARSDGTITTFAYRQFMEGTQTRVQAIQIEMKPQIRIANRFPTATLYKSCGPYQAEPECVMHMLQSIVDFIEYLYNFKD